VNGLLADPGIVRNRAKRKGDHQQCPPLWRVAEAFGSLAACAWRLAANPRPWDLYPPRTWNSAAVNEGRSRCWSIINSDATR
jgi:3-methyladenine DNA glycosylase Tag